MVCVVVGVVGKRRQGHGAHTFSPSLNAMTDAVPILPDDLENASAATSVYYNPSYHPSQHERQQHSHQNLHRHHTADEYGNVRGAALADLGGFVPNSVSINCAELSAVSADMVGATRPAWNTPPDIPEFFSPQQRPYMAPTVQTVDLARFHDSQILHPSVQMLAGVHALASSACNLDFADNVHNVGVHAHTVGAMHAHAHPLPHGTHSSMAFGHPFDYSQQTAEVTTHYPSTLPLDQSPRVAWPTCHQDERLPLKEPEQGNWHGVTLAHRVVFFLPSVHLCARPVLHVGK